ncbi:uncharacterized protein LOC116605212 [Nematostella vectensis]|uniref:uncharacterized protein LOC116605212 n=1 Tax=Nematostella vectensis TaxID=45351 RepID=UPI002076FDED|nr:uncharacterized protein LOC116605212 [Nematostella vectensis]
MRVEMYTYGKYSPTDLGIASGELPDSQITASSYRDTNPPWEGRLFFQSNLFSWCNVFSLDRKPWLQFNLSHVMLITAVAVQPRGIISARYAKTFQVMYHQHGQMTTYKDKGKSVPRTFTGNSNGLDKVVTSELDRPIVASAVRLVFLTVYQYNNWFCARAGVIGHRKKTVCPPGWLPFTENCYFFSVNKVALLDKDGARVKCYEKGANLTDITDAQELKALSANLRIDTRYFIGADDNKTEGEYRWEDGRIAELQGFWRDGEPIESSDRNCVVLMEGKLEVYSCAIPLAGHICKRKADGGYFGTPIILPSLPDVEVEKGKSIKLQCQATGDAVIYIAWLHNNTLVQNRTKDTALVFDKVPLTAKGSWKCVASNHLGQDTKSFYLHVTDPVQPQGDQIFMQHQQPSVLPQDHVIFTMLEADTLGCLTQCLGRTACRSFSYSPTEAMCILFSTSHVTANLEYREGFQYFFLSDVVVADHFSGLQ